MQPHDRGPSYANGKQLAPYVKRGDIDRIAVNMSTGQQYILDRHSPARRLGFEVGRWFASIDQRDETVRWWCSRYENEANQQEAVLEKKFKLQRLRRRIAPLIPMDRVEALDALIDLPDWATVDQSESMDFGGGFWTFSKAQGHTWWRAFYLRFYAGWSPAAQEQYRKDMLERGVDIEQEL